MLADLHTHSTASDGTTSPGQVVRAAAEAGLGVVGLTDHDTTAGWAEASEAARAVGISLLRGTEVSTRTPEASVHLLSYLQDPTDAPLADALARARGARDVRARRMVERLSADYPITWEDVLGRVPSGATIGRPHMADALVAAGIVADRDEAFARILRSGGPYDVPYDLPSPLEALELVLAAGGVPVLAHPGAGRGTAVLSDREIAELAEAGLVGLEVDHRDHGPATRARLRALASGLGLLVTGSSDFHGAGKRNALGEHTTAENVVAEIAARGRADVEGAPLP